MNAWTLSVVLLATGATACGGLVERDPADVQVLETRVDPSCNGLELTVEVDYDNDTDDDAEWRLEFAQLELESGADWTFTWFEPESSGAIPAGDHRLVTHVGPKGEGPVKLSHDCWNFCQDGASGFSLLLTWTNQDGEAEQQTRAGEIHCASSN